jgi:hypothetical protein
MARCSLSSKIGIGALISAVALLNAVSTVEASWFRKTSTTVTFPPSSLSSSNLLKGYAADSGVLGWIPRGGSTGRFIFLYFPLSQMERIAVLSQDSHMVLYIPLVVN